MNLVPLTGDRLDIHFDYNIIIMQSKGRVYHDKWNHESKATWTFANYTNMQLIVLNEGR